MAIRTSDGVWSGKGADVAKKRYDSKPTSLLGSAPVAVSKPSSSRSLNLPGSEGSTFNAQGQDTYRLANGTKSNYAAGAPSTLPTTALMPRQLTTSGIDTDSSIGGIKRTNTSTALTPFLGGYNKVATTYEAGPDDVGSQMERKRKEEEEARKRAEEMAKPPALLPMPSVPRESQAAQVKNPFDEHYRTSLLAGLNSNLSRETLEQKRQTRENMAAGGWLNGGNQALTAMESMIDAQAGNQRGANQLKADTDLAQLGGEFGLRQAGQVDNYGLSLGNLDLNYGNYALNAQRQTALLPIEQMAGKLANEAAQLTNEFSRETDPMRKQALQADLDNKLALLDTYKQMAPIQVQQAQTNLEQGKVTLEQARQELAMMRQTAPYLIDAKVAEYRQAAAEGKLRQWEAENDWWLSPLGGLVNFVQAVGVAAAGGAVKSMGA